MSRYIIHASPDRMWYVNDCLIPSMQHQGIDNITVRCDDDHLGCLESCMHIFGTIDDNGGSWHIQDDVIISKDFRLLTEKYDDGIVCGFTATAGESGVVKLEKMWWSFPCIRIPDKIANECAEWYYSFAKKYAKYYEWVYMNKCDDNFFLEFLKKNYPDINVVNLKPNLVDHVDYLLGGSLVNKNWGERRSAYFEDIDLIDGLAKKLEDK